MSIFKIGINEEGNQANHQRQHQGILCPVKIAPTYSSLQDGQVDQRLRIEIWENKKGRVMTTSRSLNVLKIDSLLYRKCRELLIAAD